MVDIPFEFVGKVASACAGAETLSGVNYGAGSIDRVDDGRTEQGS